MLRVLWLNLSTVMVHMRECMVKHGGMGGRHRIQSSEEVVADLYTYLEQLNAKCGELEAKVQKCNQRALFHRQRAKAELTQHCKQRELNRAKLYLQDKHRLQEDQDRTLRFMHLIRQQIDSLTSSQMDNIMVDAMRQYNMTAKHMGLPDKSEEIASLSKEIQARFEEVDELQHMLSDATDPCSVGLLKNDVDDDELMMELNALGDEEEESAPSALPSVPEQQQLQQLNPSSVLRQRNPTTVPPSTASATAEMGIMNHEEAADRGGTSTVATEGLLLLSG
jgi:hypothetical protein